MRIEIADRADLAGALGLSDTAVIARRQTPTGRWMPYVYAHPRDGYLIRAPRYGLFHVSVDGTRVRCAPTAVPAWLWQRSLIGEVLPFVSTIRGLEALHACAVVPSAQAGAIALTGPSGRGKSSVAAQMLLNGATLLADDVVALETHGGEVIAHPAPGLMSLRAVTVRRLGASKVRRMGVAVGANSQATRIAVARYEGTVPLAALYFLESAAESRAIRLVAVPSPDPRMLLGSTFNFALTTPARLITQLDVCSAIASRVRVVRVRMPVPADYPQVALRLLADAARTRADRVAGA